MPTAQTAPADQSVASQIPDVRDVAGASLATAAIRRRIVRRGIVLPVAAFQSAL